MGRLLRRAELAQHMSDGGGGGQVPAAAQGVTAPPETALSRKTKAPIFRKKNDPLLQFSIDYSIAVQTTTCHNNTSCRNSTQP